jgi:hypothetical protein
MADFSDIDHLTVFSPKPLAGFRARKLRRAVLPGGQKATIVEEADTNKLGLTDDLVVPKTAFAPDARARAILRGIDHAHADLSDAGGAYDLQQVRSLMRGISRQAVDKQVKEGRLLAVPGPSNRRGYPTFQFNDDGSVVNGLKSVHDTLPTRNPWAILNFLVNPQDGLRGAKPIDRLREGRLDEVLAAARGIGEQGG